MAWRALTTGPMVEIVTGHLDGREVTMVKTINAGELIDKDLSADMKTRYEAEDTYVRSIVEYGEIERGTDDDGNPTETFVPKGTQVASEEAPATDEEAAERVRKAEEVAQQAADNAAKAKEEADRHAQRVQELEAQLQDATQAHEEVSRENEQFRATAESALSYEDFDKDALAAQARAQGLVVERGDGKQGDPLKADYVQALEGARTGS